MGGSCPRRADALFLLRGTIKNVNFLSWAIDVIREAFEEDFGFLGKNLECMDSDPNEIISFYGDFPP